MLALAFLAALRANEKEYVLKKNSEQLLEPETCAPVQVDPPSESPMVVPLSVAEIRWWFFHLMDKLLLSFAYHLAWSCWRRTHQALAQRYHYKRRYALAGHLQL